MLRRLRALSLLFPACLFPGLYLCAIADGATGQLKLERPPVDVDWSSIPPPPEQRPTIPADANRLFGTVEFKSKIQKMPKWQRVLKSCRGKTSIDQDFKANRKRESAAWEQLKKDVKNAGPMEKMKAVNVFFNKWPYRRDIDNYGVADYWTTPAEFINKSGDCEDYAIVKYFALKQLGISQDNMRLVVLRDLIRNIDHAVLVVYWNNNVYVLDNMTNVINTHERFAHYRPYYSVNENFRWAHVMPAKL